MELILEEIQNLHVVEVALRCATAKTGGLYALHIARKVICKSRPSCTQNLITSPSRTWVPSPRHIEGRSALLENPFALDLAPMISPWMPRKSILHSLSSDRGAPTANVSKICLQTLLGVQHRFEFRVPAYCG